MRLNWSDDEDRPGQFALWDANCRRSLKGKAGQLALREFEAALLALPEKRLIHGRLTDDVGGVCAIACYAKYKGVDLSHFDPEDESDAVGVEAGMPPMVAWKVVAFNDIELEEHYEISEGPTQPYYPGAAARYRNEGVWLRLPYTPEERYKKVLAWVRAQLTPS